MKKLAIMGALGLAATYLCAQGLTPPSGQSKADWEEINFEFNSSILSDGYPSLLRLADLLNQHPDYKVKVTGNTDYVGSARYNDKLAMSRAETVKQFLLKYGASAGQITTAGNGKAAPEVDNKSKEGRFMNRRVVLTLTDGQGRLITEGGIGDILKALQAPLQAIQSSISDLAKKQEDCCNAILKRLDKLDDILAAMNALKGDNDRLRTELSDQRNQLNALKDQVNGLPKPLTSQQTETIAHTEAQGAVDEAQRRNKKFSLVGLNIGPTFGPSRTGNFTFSGRGQFFSPFGGDGTHAVQAQGEYMYYPDRQEGQFDIGLVNRWGNLQAGAFASFKYLNFKQYQSGGTLGQSAFLLDYIFSRGRIGLFGTKGFKTTAIVNNQLIVPGVFLQTYAQVVDQYGVNALAGVWGDATLSGNIGVLRRSVLGKGATPGGSLKLTQPITPHVAFTAEADYNESLIDAHNSGRLVFGFEVGNYIHAKDYTKITTPVPMDIPRIHYEFGTRRVGAAPPVADAGPNQTVPPGTVTLNGSASYDPLGEALTYSWQQTAGPGITLSNPTAATTTFTAAAGQNYSFRLTVKNTDGLQGSASTTVTTTAAGQTIIAQFTAQPAQIQPGQSSTLIWVLQGATSASISPTVGSVNATSGSAPVTPSTTTTYTITATGPAGTVTQNVTVTVSTVPVVTGTPQILRFEASPLTIQQGGQSTLSWTTSGATTVTISGLGSVTLNGSTTVTPAATTTYTLTASSADGHSVTAPVTVTVSGPGIPQIVTFVATPPFISPGTTTKLCWQVTAADSIAITGVGSNLNANDCATVSPTTTTTYTLTATNAVGHIQGDVTVIVGTVQILSFTANPTTSTSAGSPVVLSWQTANATQVVIIGGDFAPQTLPINGSVTINPISNETYTLTAYGAGGQTTSTTISVFVR